MTLDEWIEGELIDGAVCGCPNCKGEAKSSADELRDIFAAAIAAEAQEWNDAANETVAEAVAAEREACAKIAEEHMPECDGNGCTHIADAIRARGKHE